MDETNYNNKQAEQLQEYETLCKRCGKCCGAGTLEPCSNLSMGPDGRFYCKSYKNRLGMQSTVSGRTFTCVNIRDVLIKGIPYEGCGYIASST